MKNIRKVLALLLALTLLGAMAASAGLAEEKITLSLWSVNQMSVDDLKKPSEEWYVTKAIERFQVDHPNVEVEVSPYVDNAQVLNDFKAAMLAGYGPDVVVFMSGPSFTDVSDGLVPLNDYLDEDLLENIVGWETTAEGMDASKTIYGIPYAGQSVVCFAYNRSLIAQAGLDFDNNPPRTVEEFYAALDTIRDAGILPIHSDESYPVLLLYNLGMWWEQISGVDGILAHYTEGTSFTEDEGFLTMMEEYKKFYDNGWINEDTATSADEFNVFLQGGSALNPIGVWDLENFSAALGDDLGLLAIPTWDESMVDVDTAVGGIGAALAVSSFSPHKEEAIEFAKFLVSHDEMVEYYKANPSVPARKDITAEDIGLADDPLFARMVGMAGGTYYWPDNCLSPDAANVYYQFPCQVLVGNMTALELAEMLDEAMED